MLRRNGTALPLWTQLVSNPLSSKCFHKTHSLGLKNIITSRTRVFFNFGQVEAEAMPRACACSGQLGAPYRVKRAFPLVRPGPTQRSGRAFPPAESWPLAATSGLFLWSNQDRRSAPGVRLLRPNRGLVPRQAVFSFGQIRTDTALQACVYSGRIVASCRVKRSFPSITTISDRLGLCAPKAIRAQAVTYPAEGHLEDYASLKG
jgi:hypothetical protein